MILGDLELERLKLSYEAEKEFIKNVTIVDYTETKRLLNAINDAILTGVKVNQIVSAVERLTELQRINLD